MRRFASHFVSNQKVIGNVILNAMGLQIARIFVFWLALARGRRQHRIALAHNIETLKRDGIAVIPNYLPEAEFAEARAAFYQILGGNAGQDRYENPGEPVNIALIPIAPAVTDNYPILRLIFESPELLNAFSYLAGRPVKIGTVIAEYIRHRAGENDDQTALHADTFFPNQNAWLFVEDCEVADGPFVYSPASHRLTPARLLFQYVSSLRYFFGESPSPRISPWLLRIMGASPQPIPVRANTLVISNNFGLHARGIGRPGAIRAGYKLSMKATPFSRTG